MRSKNNHNCLTLKIFVKELIGINCLLSHAFGGFEPLPDDSVKQCQTHYQ